MWAVQILCPRFGQKKRVVDEMEAKQEKLALLGMLGYDLTWHRYIYKTLVKRALEKWEAGLQGTKPMSAW